MSTPITTEELDDELAKLSPLREALANCEESGFPGSGAVLIPRDCALRLVDELVEAKRELATLKAQLAETTRSLECSHCGGDAITSPTGLFGEGDSEKCSECGMPGRVSVYEDLDGATATWWTSDDPDDRCERDDCDECPPRRGPFEGVDHPSTATAPTLAESLANQPRYTEAEIREANGLPTANPDDFDLRGWNPGGGMPPDGVLP